MTAELWSTVFAGATFVVIAATAIAAMIQLRHLRTTNQLSGLISVLELFQQPHIHDLINFVRKELPARMESEDFRAGLKEIPIDRIQHPELHLCEMYEEIGSYVRSGLIDEELFLRAHWYNVGLYWRLLRPVIAIARTNRPYIFENFEYLAARAQGWSNRHPQGNYPNAVPRMLPPLVPQEYSERGAL